ncbi:hypothetical protein T11_11591 [Trichinella zimbabwensis]|uniref:Uncharacterized protein n=1 Tax=Trichinella zimbabwensis TaxID=268475 RepID=A0A0V1GJ85_9BILA|nr:hypothetical protein T11_11591 [Trichinella zimbabwensis]
MQTDLRKNCQQQLSFKNKDDQQGIDQAVQRSFNDYMLF